ncbi:hypothetical protein CEXT_595151 [Caerostris extrusa]|uniref:Uncharacterized protein n=1 Tax=Caerostris extrusa TaxID=172846 RepID=A0AAV4PKQ8_CAEEX|nr:hypothetical protein CEXT_595151 [Caerostris extrusa]
MAGRGAAESTLWNTPCNQAIPLQAIAGSKVKRLSKTPGGQRAPSATVGAVLFGEDKYACGTSCRVCSRTFRRPLVFGDTVCFVGAYQLASV